MKKATYRVVVTAIEPNEDDPVLNVLIEVPAEQQLLPNQGGDSETGVEPVPLQVQVRRALEQARPASI